MTSRGGTSHIASIFSMADLVAVLYADVLRYDPNNPRMPERDRLILSKGHAGAGIYAALAESGFFPVEELLTHCQNGSRLSGHVSHKGVPGVEASTGSLGQGMLPWVTRFCTLLAAVKEATATEPKRLMADCMTMVPEAVIANCNAIGIPIASWGQPCIRVHKIYALWRSGILLAII